MTDLWANIKNKSAKLINCVNDVNEITDLKTSSSRGLFARVMLCWVKMKSEQISFELIYLFR